MKKINLIILPICISSVLNAAGYKIPEQSVDSIALAGSNYAYSFGADAAYYNPANMMFMPNIWHSFEAGLSYFHLGKTNFKNKSKVPGTYSTTSENYSTVAPQMYFISPEYIPNLRFGLSTTVPAGVQMRWDDPYPATTSKKFDLKVLEINPSIAYRLSDQISLGLGLRVLYSDGAVKNGTANFNRSLQGDSADFGYNLGLTYRPIEDLSLSATYRSKVDMTIKGDGDFTFGNTTMSTPTKINLPLPANLVLAIAYNYNAFTYMFAYERTYWSDFKELDFNYDKKMPNPIAKKIFDDPVQRNWDDSNTYRFGVAFDATTKLRLMAGFAIDENPAHSDKMNFELPNSKSYIYSTGLNYKFSPKFEVGLGYLYMQRTNQEVNSYTGSYIGTAQGTMNNGDAQIANLTFRYNF